MLTSSTSEVVQTKQIKPHHRLDWVDQVKGLTIFLVVYGHNFPFCEKYIYSFHMPLFIMVAGFFHPKVSDSLHTVKRFRSLVIPYLIWSLFLFAIWFFITRNVGDSAALNLSPLKNLIGVFYSQGDRAYMDWGIPLWFLPALFVCFYMMHLVLKISNPVFRYITLTFLIASGLIYPHATNINLPWSINIAMVALFFYAFGLYFFKSMAQWSFKVCVFVMIAAALANYFLYDWNIKIDMYRAIYGNEALFILNGITGSLMVLCFFKAVPVFNFLGYIGKFSLVILALQLLAMTGIKFILLMVLHQTDFNFSETQRFLYSILQIALMIPIFWIINKYMPILNGGFKKI